MFFYTSFFCSGTQSMVSQLFFAARYPDRKYELLTLTLFLGALSALLGLLAGARLRYISNRLLPLFALAGIAGFAIQMGAGAALLYIFRIYAGQFFHKCAFNIFDNYFMHAVDKSLWTQHIKLLLQFQMLGYVVSPLFFSLFAENKPLCVAAAALLGMAAYFFPLTVRSQIPEKRENKNRPSKKPVPIDRGTRFFLAYVVSVFAGVYIFMAMAEYLLRDFYQMADSPVICAYFLWLSF
jgi:hypothetical protein